MDSERDLDKLPPRLLHISYVSDLKSSSLGGRLRATGMLSALLAQQVNKPTWYLDVF